MLFRSPHPDPSTPSQPLTEFVLEPTAKWADKPALIDGPSGRILTFKALGGAIQKAAKGLADKGMKKGEVLAIYSPNLPEYAVAFHGVSVAGGVSTTINPLYTPEELARQLNDSKARFLLTVPPFLDKAKAAAKESSVEEIFVFGEAEGATPFASLLDNDGDAPRVDIAPEDIVTLPYSSGTTGLQKGVMLTHRNLVANLTQTESTFGDGLGEEDVAIGILPFFHIYGMVVIMNLALHRGCTVVTMPKFDLEEFLGLMQKYKITIAHLVPPIVLALAKHPVVDQYDLSSLRWLMSGAAPLGKDVAEACAKRLDCLVLQGYGLTETSPVSHCNQPDPEKIKVGSVGPCIAGTECKIVDPSSGEELGPNEEGEIWIRGPQVMKGYLNKPDATAECIDADGFFHTGDVGYADEDGYFFIVDRLKELIKYKGMQVAPAELEALLLAHPSVSDAAVIPKPDEEAGEIPKACVVLREEIDAQTLQDFIAERVAPHKKIREVEFVDQIPKSPSGKILRRVLVERERLKAAP